MLDVISNCKWLPTVAELREAAARLSMPTLPADAEAWAEVLAAISRYHYIGKPEFSHPAIERAVRGVGWQNICLSEQIGVERAHFFRLYGQVCEQTRADARMLPQVRALAANLDSRRRALPSGEVGGGHGGGDVRPEQRRAAADGGDVMVAGARGMVE